MARIFQPMNANHPVDTVIAQRQAGLLDQRHMTGQGVVFDHHTGLGWHHKLPICMRPEIGK